MKVLYFYREDWEPEYMKERLPGFDIDFKEGTVQDFPDLKDNEAEVLCVFVKSNVGPEEMDRFPKLKLIATRSTGFDHVDVAEAGKRDISVVNVPTYGESTVAEFTFALMLTLSRKVYDAYDRVRENGSFSQEGLRGFDLNGKTIGVIGTGNIGRHAIVIAKGFGMNVLAYDINRDEEFAKETGFEYVEFDDLLARSDIVTLHVPYNKHTHHLINSENISKLKKGAYLINTSRGGVVETEALIRALKDEILAGAGLDVLEEEGETMSDEVELLFDPHPEAETLKTLLANHYLIDHPRVVITPHNAFNTEGALRRILDTTAENIKSFSEGNPQNRVVVK